MMDSQDLTSRQTLSQLNGDHHLSNGGLAADKAWPAAHKAAENVGEQHGEQDLLNHKPTAINLNTADDSNKRSTNGTISNNDTEHGENGGTKLNGFGEHDSHPVNDSARDIGINGGTDSLSDQQNGDTTASPSNRQHQPTSASESQSSGADDVQSAAVPSSSNQSASTDNSSAVKTLSAPLLPRPVVAAEPTGTNLVKNVFNVRTPSPSPDSPPTQDIKDGHAYLRPMAKVIYKLGQSLLREVVYEALYQHIDSQITQGSKKYSKVQHQSLQKSLQALTDDNDYLRLKHNKVCGVTIDGRRCTFRSESQLVMETHRNEAHYNRSNRLYCARCDFSTAIASHFKTHMADAHSSIASITKPLSFWPCKLCFFETNSESRLQTHVSNCTKNFSLNKNLRPGPSCDSPLGESIFKPLPTVKPTVSNPYTPVRPKIIQPKGVPQSAQLSSGKAQVLSLSTQKSMPKIIKPQTPGSHPAVTQIGGKSVNQADVCECEICGGLIQGDQALKVHMQWCHDINITHLKSASLCCPTEHCGRGFWTVQGLARHQKECFEKTVVRVVDEGSRCFICRKTYSLTLISHILAQHLKDLKTMVEGRRCLGAHCLTPSGTTYSFSNIEGLQSHLAQCHRLKLTGLSALSSSTSSIKFQPYCSICRLKFTSSTAFAEHCAARHVHKCDLCGAQCSTVEGVKEHLTLVHKNRYCLACSRDVSRQGFLQHVQHSHHVYDCQIKVKRVSQSECDQVAKKRRMEGLST